MIKTTRAVNYFVYSLALPGRPQDLRVVFVNKNTVALEWKEPKSDGGLEITEYFIEKRMVGQDRYLPATDKVINVTKITMETFSEGDNYEFRCSAINAKGKGIPSFPTKPIVCRDIIRKLVVLAHFCFLLL